MDDQDLKKILGNINAPPPGENARKRALNLALAEFESAQKEKQKNFKGSGFASRLKGTAAQKRRDPMKKRYVYGGLATAMVVVLAATVSFQQVQEHPKGDFSGSGNTFSNIAENIGTSKPLLPFLAKRNEAPSAAQMNKVEFDVDSGSGNRQRVQSADVERVEEALRSGQSALPTPYAPPAASMVPAPAEEPPAGDSMQRWRKLQELRQSAPAEAKAMAGRAPGMAQGSTAGQIGSPTSGDIVVQPSYQDVGRDQFEDFEENPVKLVKEEPVSTFSVDVDTASYAFLRRQINNGVLPQKDAVRIEEMINYFDYDYPLPETKDEPFKPTVTVVPSPWAEGRKLIHIGIKGYDIAPEEKPKSNLVFLLDVSGSMNSPDKLPLLKNSFKLLLETLDENDTVAIVTYAGRAGTVLEPTSAARKGRILQALEDLHAGGGTAGGEGIRQAYNLAEASFDKDAVNRVILATDGDFNVGITNPEELKDFIERKRETGIFLSILGFGQGNLNDHMMQTLAQNGNGVAAHIDSLNEARKVLVEEASSTLFPIAKDVKIQVEFNPSTVAEYRLIGYETRHLNREDFNNDAVDAGDIGAGHTVTAIYEITPFGGPRTVDESRYAQAEQHTAQTDFGDEYAFLKIRYKKPDEDTSNLITTPITRADEVLLVPNTCPEGAQCLVADQPGASKDVRFAIAVAGFGQLLKGGKHTGAFGYDDVIALAQGAKGGDPFGYRAEFINLVRLAKSSASMEKTAP